MSTVSMWHDQNSSHHKEVRGAHTLGGREHNAQATEIEVHGCSPSKAHRGDLVPGAGCDKEDAPGTQQRGS